MVELAGNPESHGIIHHGFSDWVFVGPAIIIGCLVAFFFYKLVQSLLDKEKKREEKKRRKQGKQTSAGSGAPASKKVK